MFVKANVSKDFKMESIVKCFDLDNILIMMSIAFIIFPIIIFLWGWTNPIVSLIGTVILTVTGVYVYKAVVKEFTISIKKNMSFWFISIAIIVLWCLFSGIGKFSYQTPDFKARNTFFHDLCYCSWPVSFDMDKQPEFVRNLLSNVKSANLVYYYAWWLPVAAIVKVLNLNSMGANILLQVYATIEVFLIFYCLLNVLKRYSYIALSAFILFGGYDFWIYFIENFSFPSMGHVEWWAKYFQYSSNTTQLYWVFNSSLPIWLITCILIILPKNKYKAAWGALSFAYSPFATVSMVFIVLSAMFNTKSEKLSNKIKEIFSVINIVTSLFMLIVLGSYYLQVNIEGTSIDGWIFDVYPEQKLFTVYLLFLMVEVGLYFIVIGFKAHEERFYWVTLIGLILTPFIKIGRYNDWSLKVPLPLLFLLMIIVVRRYYIEDIKIKKYAILTVLFLGYMTSTAELQRNIVGTLTMSEEEYTWHVIDTFGYIDSGEEGTDKIFALQYLAPKKDNFWNRYISK
jgi:hypothetical protein